MQYFVTFHGITAERRDEIRNRMAKVPGIFRQMEYHPLHWVIEINERDLFKLHAAINPETEKRDNCVITAATPLYNGFMRKDLWEFLEKGELYKGDAPVAAIQPNTPPVAADKDTQDFASALVTDALDFKTMSVAPEIRPTLDSYINGLAFRQTLSKAGYTPKNGMQNILISGPSGVGKTTLAKALAKAIVAARNTPDAPVYLIKPSDIIARYSGQSTNNLKQLFTAAADGIIIFDEIDAYANIPSFGAEVLNAINTHIGNNPNRPLVIGTLYESGKGTLDSNNSGLRSRFRHSISIPSQNDDILTEHFIDLVTKTGLQIDRGLTPEIKNLIAEIRKNSKGQAFGHIREIEGLIDLIIDLMGERHAKTGQSAFDFKITLADIPVRDSMTGTFVARKVAKAEEKTVTAPASNVVALGQPKLRS